MPVMDTTARIDKFTAPNRRGCERYVKKMAGAAQRHGQEKLDSYKPVIEALLANGATQKLGR